ncbi:sigma-70 family RNA polymerase sigma factor [Calditerrivibrio nitroreducens]|uniref:RNA polymerase, sigma 28 subunit, SigD/FliA/WhiG n=1 Tax=Calditerrivibrio nitroreducens (strain DSM 19672 / NBRC 101217 / Yu37-1) TaxID=768670 RepID=E4THL6_CALNY|nr:FliA/WhiG family RNA polymerase sigma factor [Calditerrivibrio nitroreducens]ADR18841.1 RNA polymerase, sigma 28 subunit, SigD/FliA/WhiG [Calditerrivibrio nitroreducens DSM 19672]
MSLALYQGSLDRIEQEEIVKEFLPKIKVWVLRVSNRLPANVDNDELYSAACMGLVESLQKFDKGRSVDFYSYAERRIKGAILDALRQMDFLPRNVRTKLKQFEEKLQELTVKLGRKPNTDEIVEYTNLSQEDVFNFLNLIETGQLTSLDTSLDEDGDISLLDTIKSFVEGPEDSAIKEQLISKLGEIIDSLPDKEKLVITLYYYEELTMKEIGEVLKISESRVSQIHSEAVKKLKRKLKGVL